MRTKVLLFGGTSYVGQFLVQALLDADVEIVAIAHNLTSARILLAKQLGSLRLVSHEEAMRTNEIDVAAVINLAYVKSASPHRANRENERLVRSVHEAAVHHRCERVIQASTIAVFGYEPLVTPMPTRVPVLPGNFYIETKARAEHMLLRQAAGGGYHLAIVRLGNVLGPGSPAWTANLAQRLLEGKPLETQKSSAARTQLVRNAASYLCH
jgi:nucleoside-diphosphate-sugar epimerase